MKILMFSRLYEPHIGGVEKHVKQIAKRLLKKGFQVTLITERYLPSLPEEEVLEGIRVFRVTVLNTFRFFNKFIIWYWLLKHQNLIYEADIVHCHDIFFWYLPFRFLFSHKPVYITFHGWEGIYPIPKRYILARKIWEKLACGNICVGDYLEKWYGTQSTLVSYGGVETEETETKAIVKERIVFIGRLEEDVSLLTYLKVLEILKRKKVVFEAEFYGDGPLRKKAEELGKVFGFTENILPKISTAKFIFASSYLVILEALSLKKMVISVWENLLKKDYLLLSPFKDLLFTSSNAKEIYFFINDQMKVSNFVKKGYLWARAQTWEKVTDIYLKLWKVKL